MARWMTQPPLVRLTNLGLYCEAGDFYIDPWGSVPRAVITHAHGDHLRPGSSAYLAASEGERLIRPRIHGARLKLLPFGEHLRVGDVILSFHPAGHILGSAQVRIERESNGEIWVVSGDYKTTPDPTCTPFELVRCHTFITESTFGLPIYRWPAQKDVYADLHAWWRANQQASRASILFAYPLGKSQRLLAQLDPSIGPIYTHGSVEQVNMAYRASGITLPPTIHVGSVASSRRGKDRPDWSQSIVLAPPVAKATPWMRQFGDASTAFASGWMLIRGARRRRSVDRGFVISDHADWPELMSVIRQTGAEHVLVTHGYNAVVSRWLQEQGIDAHPIDTPYEAEVSDVNDMSDVNETLSGIDLPEVAESESTDVPPSQKQEPEP